MGLFGKKKEEQAGGTFKCQYCDMKFDDKERMKRHMKKAHSEKGGGDMPNMNPFGFS
ncbi:C2H2-type zinc finger protein [Nitrososphaera viennensis]|uniref:Zinc finger C2H2 domain-containing protein n=2 Tax=Nitrososphaera viennensis TaxID=1034015 RepID=A0A060HL03_9ARCH|nr:C2H2-type zinc finger protein [Nitrososphaera viennensis]AIC17199.1 zinc finger C2H2 domain-containing protein [Nitrososphaera viennensis EN76]UVS69086.1 C2H2-type zinc finger protein [Nitrososphaera viennensis]